MPNRDGTPRRLSLDALATTLQSLVDEGIESFYRGDIAKKVIADIESLGGTLTAEDLEAYEARYSDALEIRYRDALLYAMPGLFAGHSIDRVFELLSTQLLAGPAPNAQSFVAYAKALDQAYRERLEQQGDGWTPEPTSTSHLSVRDRQGNMVAYTQTLLSLFGSRVVLPETGILMNNGVMWFDPRSGRHNSIAPGKRPLSNMCPLIGRSPTAEFALGASGGRKIMPAVAQIASFLVDFGMEFEEAFRQPRIDVSAMKTIGVSDELPDEVFSALTTEFSSSHVPNQPYPLGFSCPSGVMHDPLTGENFGTAEPQHPWADAVSE